MYESEIESTTARRALEELGVFSIKLKSTQERGYPDRIFLIPGGRPLFVEFKVPGKSAEAYQVMIHKRLRHAGYQVEVHDNVEKSLRAISKALDARR